MLLSPKKYLRFLAAVFLPKRRKKILSQSKYKYEQFGQGEAFYVFDSTVAHPAHPVGPRCSKDELLYGSHNEREVQDWILRHTELSQA